MNSPTALVVASIDSELEATTATASRLGWSTEFDKEKLRLTFTGRFPKDGSDLCLVAQVDDYPMLPPIWTFHTPNDDAEEKKVFPQAGTLGTGKGSIFHGNNLVCAHFSRMAFGEYKGPHGNWGPASSWRSVSTEKYVSAMNIAQMLAIIVGHLHASPGLRDV